MSDERLHEPLLPLILSFAAGYVEAVCFIGLFHTFTTFITGTLMILVIELVNGQAGYANKAVVFVSFFLFTFCWVLVIRNWPWREALLRPLLLLLEAGLIAVFALLGTLLEPLASAAAFSTLLVSLSAVFAMSLHSSIFFVLLNKLAPTHFMTGNLTNFSVGLVDLHRARRQGDPEAIRQARFKAWHYPKVIGCFVGGVALGSLAYLLWGFVVLLLPAAAVLLAAVVAART